MEVNAENCIHLFCWFLSSTFDIFKTRWVVLSDEKEDERWNGHLLMGPVMGFVGLLDIEMLRRAALPLEGPVVIVRPLKSSNSSHLRKSRHFFIYHVDYWVWNGSLRQWVNISDSVDPFIAWDSVFSGNAYINFKGISRTFTLYEALRRHRWEIQPLSSDGHQWVWLYSMMLVMTNTQEKCKLFLPSACIKSRGTQSLRWKSSHGTAVSMSFLLSYPRHLPPAQHRLGPHDHDQEALGQLPTQLRGTHHPLFEDV